MKQQVVISEKEILEIVGNFVLDHTNLTHANARFELDPLKPHKIRIIVEEIK